MKVFLISGLCPNCCNFEHNEIKLMLNTMDAWECPECKITFNQIGENEVGLNGCLGIGKFKSNQPDPARYLDKMTIYRKPMKEGETMDDCKMDDKNELFIYLTRLYSGEFCK